LYAANKAREASMAIHSITRTVAACAVAFFFSVAAAQPAAAAPVKQDNCKKLSGSKLKQCKLNLKVYKKLLGLELTGTRTEDSGGVLQTIEFSLAYCDKKKVVRNGDATNFGWEVEKAKKTSDGIEARVNTSGGSSGGFDTTYPDAVRLKGKFWEVGRVNTSRPFLRDFVTAEASPARC
jgi:hypothetical protein